MKFEDKIDDYLMGNLNPNDLVEFENEMKRNTDFNNEVIVRQQFFEGVESVGRDDLRKELKSIHLEMQEDLSKAPQSKRSNKLILLIVLSVCLVGAFLANHFYNKMKISSTPEDVYMAYYEPFKLSSVKRSGSEQAYLQIKENYENKQYAAVVHNEVLTGENINTLPSEILMAVGVSHLELKNLNASTKFFNLILERGDFNFEDEATWYASLAALRKGDKNKAVNLLQVLVADAQRDHHDEAVKLLEDIDGIVQ